MNNTFKKLKGKYPLAALILCIVACLLGKPILDESAEQTTATETVTTEIAAAESEATEADKSTALESAEITAEPEIAETITEYTFRSEDQFISHYEKHGIEMGFASAEEYLEAANRVISSPDALYKREAEDNDHVYYLEETNEFVVLSEDGYIRTYFLPSAGIDYFNRQ